ncbi:MAG: hypothetical protein OEV85_12055 [Candidatus Thorarchaeota archaeon]|nr:hypothetical protein [Candidatus Thorarchaeota archaeon]
MGKARFILPTFMFVAGMAVAVQLIMTITEPVPPTSLFPTMLSETLGNDIVTIMIIAFPIFMIEYVILAVPAAVVLLVITRIVKSARYEMDIMNIGRDFNGTQIIRRAAAPALFSVASSQLFRDVIKNILFPFGYAPIAEIAPLHEAGLSLMSALLFVPIALILFMPTWILNDAGVVTHLKSDSLELRQTPDTQGVGRWIANMLGGYALLAYPITMFLSQFYNPLILPILQGTIPPNELTGLVIYQGTLGLLWTLGLPFFVMAYILPVIMFNEALQTRSTVRILRLAQRLGAKIIKKEQITEIKRPNLKIIEDQTATVDLWAKAQNQEIVMSSKKIKMSDTKIKSNNVAKKSTKKKESKKDTKKSKKK